jgi:hypothetical protein
MIDQWKMFPPVSPISATRMCMFEFRSCHSYFRIHLLTHSLKHHYCCLELKSTNMSLQLQRLH